MMDAQLVRRKVRVFKFKGGGFVDGHLAVEAELLCTRVVIA
ncbi:hypothetical protein E5P2_00542 (plasmid) [Variovorax sp. PBL-E5]|nr:hypothetical protein E5P2_00542 [Variovorax sp. PBL-E5]